MRILRRLLWLIAFIALATMVCVVTLFLLITPENVQQHLQKICAENGLTLQMNEVPSVKILPTVEIHLPAATIKNSSDVTIAQFRMARFDLKPWWLLLGRSHIQVLTLEGLTAQINDPAKFFQTIRTYRTENASFFTNVVIESLTLKEADFRLIAPQYTVQLANLSAYIANPAPQMHAPVSFSSQLRLKTDSKDLLLENESSFTLDVDMASGSIAFEQLHLHASGTYNGAATQLGLDSPLLQIRSDSLYSKTALLSLSHAEQSQQLTLSTAELKITPDQIEAPDLRVVYQRGLGKNHFELDLRSPIIFKQLEGLWEAGHLQGRVLLPQATAPSPLSGQAHGSLANKLVNLTLFSRLNDSPVNFQGEIVGYQHPSIEGELVIGRSRIKDLELLSSVSNSSQPLENTVGDQPSTDDDQSTRLSDKETAIESVQSAPHQTSSDLPTTALDHTQQASEEVVQTPNSPRYDFELLDHFDFKGNIVIGELEMARLKAQQVKAPATVQNGVLRLSPISALLYDGRAEADLTIQASGQWNITADAGNISVEALSQSAGATQKIPGIMNLQIHFFGNGTSTSSATGQIGFSTINTKLFGLNLYNALKKVENFEPLREDPTEFTPVDQISGVVTIHNESAKISPLTIQFKGVPMSGAADLNIDDETVTGEINGSLRGLKTKLYISGNWWQPTLSLNSEEFQAINQITAPEPIVKPQEQSTRWDKIKEFIKKHF